MPMPLHFGYPRARFAGPPRPRRVLAGLAARPREDQVPWTAGLLVGRLAPSSVALVLTVGSRGSVGQAAPAAVLLGWSPAR
jgi:hypothetical protein